MAPGHNSQPGARADTSPTEFYPQRVQPWLPPYGPPTGFGLPYPLPSGPPAATPPPRRPQRSQQRSTSEGHPESSGDLDEDQQRFGDAASPNEGGQDGAITGVRQNNEAAWGYYPPVNGMHGWHAPYYSPYGLPPPPTSLTRRSRPLEDTDDENVNSTMPRKKSKRYVIIVMQRWIASLQKIVTLSEPDLLTRKGSIFAIVGDLWYPFHDILFTGMTRSVNANPAHYSAQ